MVGDVHHTGKEPQSRSRNAASAARAQKSDNLILSRSFAPLFATQGLAAFNDNFLKNTLVFLILWQVGRAELGAESAASLITVAGAVFMLPFLLLSALGGQLADKFDKAALARQLKAAEIAAAGYLRAGTLPPVHSRHDVRAVLVRRRLGPVRTRQIRHPSRPPATPGASQGERLDRGRHLCGDPGRHHRCRPVLCRGHRPMSVFGVMMMALAIAC